jgi:integrase/recombinase XerD
MTWEDLRVKFLGDLEIRNYSARTVSDYGYTLGQFFEFLRERNIKEPQAVTTSIMIEFQRWIYFKPTKQGIARSVRHQNTVLATVKSFFRFLKNDGFIHRDPANDVEYAREPQTLPRNVLTPKEALRIIESIDTTTVLGYRDRTIFEVLYASGIRSSELRGLKVGSVNLEEELLFIKDGKGAKDRIVPLSSVACKFLETYIKGIRPALLRGGSTEILFLSCNGRPMDPYTLGMLAKKYARLARVKKHMTCHVWRHTCATHLVKNNANLKHVQSILGHGSLNTTEKYLRLTIADLKAAHRKFHPREKGVV